MFFEENGIYHIYNRSNELVFKDRDNYIFFLDKVSKLLSPNCNIMAWVLMPNHFHFLIEATNESCKLTNEKHRPDLQLLSKNIGILLSSYSQAFNKQNNRRGNLFAHKTKAKLLNDSINQTNRSSIGKLDYATACFLYIHQNPVLAGLSESIDNWEFSSFRDYAGLRNGKLIQKEIAEEIIELDFDNFLEQSNFIVEETLLKRIF